MVCVPTISEAPLRIRGCVVAEPTLSEETERLIQQHIHSVEQLEVLLLLRDRRDRAWTAAEVSRELRTISSSAAQRLSDLVRRGFLKEGPAESHRYDPGSALLSDAV